MRSGNAMGLGTEMGPPFGDFAFRDMDSGFGGGGGGNEGASGRPVWPAALDIDGVRDDEDRRCGAGIWGADGGFCDGGGGGGARDGASGDMDFVSECVRPSY